jgi:hypothetical protein
MNDWFYFLNIILLRKIQLVTSYSLKLEIRLGQNVNMYTNRLCHLWRNGFVSM